jgi:hypothetical protein
MVSVTNYIWISALLKAKFCLIVKTIKRAKSHMVSMTKLLPRIRRGCAVNFFYQFG